METIWAVIGGLGIGSLVTMIIQHYLARRGKKEDRRIEEMKEAFTGLLTAQAKVIQNSGSIKTQIDFALWEARVQLVASPKTSECIKQMKNTSPNSQERGAAIEKMLLAMRKDLGIANER